MKRTPFYDCPIPVFRLNVKVERPVFVNLMRFNFPSIIRLIRVNSWSNKSKER